MRHGTNHRIRSLRLSTLLLLTLGIVVGLLGMHTFTADPLGHGAVPQIHASSNMVDDAGMAPHQPAGDAPLTVHPDPAHTGMGMMCVLALLAVLLLVVRPSLTQLFVTRIRSAGRIRASASRTAPRRPPSQIVLCISRT